MTSPTFAEWMTATDAEVVRRMHVSADDLPDIDYRGLYDDGETPAAQVPAADWGF